MVNLGRSKGCNTCKQRRVKCDEGKPSCDHCMRLDRQCGGYERKPPTIKFKAVQVNGLISKHQRPHNYRARDNARVPERSSVIPALTLAERDVALSFFLGHFAVMGRDLASTRGFFETMVPILSSEHHTSAVSLAITALATRLLRLWRDGSCDNKTPFKPLSQAFRRLQCAIDDPIESKSQATILAALVLQFYENIRAVHQLRKATRTHHDGAVALLKHQGPEAHSTAHGKHLLAYVLHSEVSSAIREKRALPAGTLSWLKYDDMPLNSSSALDIIGISIANLQYHLSKLPSQNHFATVSQQDLSDLWAVTEATSARLLDWSQTVPKHWQPVKQEHVKACNPPIITYSGNCEIYPSIQVAAIWNVWRCYRLILLKMFLTLLHLGQQSPPDFDGSQGPSDETNEDSFARKSVQDIVDSICQSVPFFLGNRTERTKFSDLSDPHIVVPGLQDLQSGNGTLPDYIRNVKHMSQDEHTRHAIVQGPWHIISPLTHILSLCSEPNGSYLTQALRPGQLQWIRQQLVRVATLLGLELGSFIGDMGENRVNADAVGADTLTILIREGLSMTSGL